MQGNYLAIDIGGTTIKADVYNEEGQSQDAFNEVPTKIDMVKQTNGILAQVCDLIAAYNQDKQLMGVAISSAGVIDSKKGEVAYSGYTIPGYIGTPFKTEIMRRFQLPVYIANDVNCAAMGEYWKGAGQNTASLFMITLGTGIGGSYILDGHTVAGHGFTAGEVGYLPMHQTDWQSLASTTGLLKLYYDKTGQQLSNGKAFFKLIDTNDPTNHEVLDTYTDYLVEGLLTLSYVTNPDKLIIGGGIMARKDVLLPLIKTKLSKRVMDTRFLPKEILPAALGNEAGRLGALYGLLQLSA